MILKHKAELAGRVKLQISGGERGTIDYDWFDNMILDQGLLFAATKNGDNLASKCSVGSSSTPVVKSQTDIQSLIARAIGYLSRSGYDEAGGFGWSKYVYTFPREQAAGNISELAVGLNTYNVPSNEAIARTLVKDSAGNPTTITVLLDEVLTVTWEFRRWWTQPASHVVEYTIDEIPNFTTVTYPPYSSLENRPSYGLAQCTMNGCGFTLLATDTDSVTGEWVTNYPEAQGNPAISSIQSPRHLGSTQAIYILSVATFDPPIPKNNQFRAAIKSWLTIARRGE